MAVDILAEILKYKGVEKGSYEEMAWSGVKGEWGESRVDAVASIVMDSRLTVGWVAPEGFEFVRITNAWLAALAPITDEFLVEYYLRTLRSKFDGSAVSAVDIISTWNNRTQVREAEQFIPAELRGKY